jgi:triacylglycerol lipase
MSKPLPGPLDLIPPNEDGYRYFESPLDPEVLGFDLRTAAWMADAAMLAYSDPAFALPIFRDRGGLPGWAAFGHAAPAAPAAPATSSTQCYVAHSDRAVVVVYRGTEVPGPRDLTRFITRLREVARDVEVDARLRFVPYAGGRVHGGFLDALEEVWAPLADYPDALRRERPTRPVWFTGHSLGGALATLAAERYARERGDVAGAGSPPRPVYTFGAPAVGDATFVRGYGERGVPTYRVVHHRDLIARVPLHVPEFLPDEVAPPYEPVGSPVYLRAGGARIDGAVPGLGLAGWLEGLPGPDEWLELLTVPGDARLQWLLDRVPGDRLSDHAPIYYATYLWNLWEQSAAWG